MAGGTENSPTLLVIDLQEGHINGDPSWGPRSTPDLIHNVALLLDFWRGRGWPVLHVLHNDSDPESPLHPDNLETFRAHACSAPLQGEQIFHKTVGSAFIGTGLGEVLRQKDVKEIYMIGIDGAKCITSSARHACDLGFAVTVVEDACATYGMQNYRDASETISAEETHHASMNLLANYEAKVVVTADLLKSLHRN